MEVARQLIPRIVFKSANHFAKDWHTPEGGEDMNSKQLLVLVLLATLAMIAAGCAAPAAPAATAAPAGPVAGSCGTLRILYWQAVTVLNSHHSQGTKDYDSARLVLEPLLAFNPRGEA